MHYQRTGERKAFVSYIVARFLVQRLSLQMLQAHLKPWRQTKTFIPSKNGSRTGFSHSDSEWHWYIINSSLGFGQTGEHHTDKGPVGHCQVGQNLTNQNLTNQNLGFLLAGRMPSLWFSPLGYKPAFMCTYTEPGSHCSCLGPIWEVFQFWGKIRGTKEMTAVGIGHKWCGLPHPCMSI